ncbi:nucleoside-diphosphate kinase [Enterococcus sp. LJL99]
MEQTLIIIKPDGVRRHLVGRILQRFEERNLTISNMYLGTITQEKAKTHYDHLKNEAFFTDIIDYMVSGPVVFAIIEGPNVIALTRKMIGATNPFEAAPGTIRGDFALTSRENVIHASDSIDTAKIEIERFFD